MESMGRKKPRRRRSFTPEFKAEIVELCQRGDRSVGQVARDFDLTETAVAPARRARTSPWRVAGWWGRAAACVPGSVSGCRARVSA